MQLSAALDRDVVDRTGIAGTFDMHLDLTAGDLFPFARQDGAADSSDPGASAMPVDSLGAIMHAVQKLGLKLEPARAPGETLIIDHVERPSEN